MRPSRAPSRRCGWARPTTSTSRCVATNSHSSCGARSIAAAFRPRTSICATCSRPSRRVARSRRGSSPPRSTPSRSTCCWRGSTARRGLAIFHRAANLGSDDVVVRGFREPEGEALRRSLVGREADRRRVGRQRRGPRTRVSARRPACRRCAVRTRVGGADPRARGRGRRAARARSGAPLPRPGGRDRPAGRRARTGRDPERRALSPGEGTRLRRRRHRRLQRPLPLHGDRPRDPSRRALRQSALGALPRPRPLQARERPHGHLVGSRTLRRLAECSASCIRQVDTLARYGGDEFTILLVDTGLESGLLVAERIRNAVGRRTSRRARRRRSSSRSASASRPSRSRSHRRRADSTWPTRRCTGPSRSAATASAPPAISDRSRV